MAVVHKNHIQLQKHCILQSLVSMECGHFQIKFGLEMVSLFIIYCIPNTSVLQFCEEMVSISENSIEINNNKNYNNNNKYNKLLQQHNYSNTTTTTTTMTTTTQLHNKNYNNSNNNYNNSNKNYYNKKQQLQQQKKYTSLATH